MAAFYVLVDMCANRNNSNDDDINDKCATRLTLQVFSR